MVNHTSIEHPWFKAAGDRESPYHDYYIWADEKPANADEGVIFPGVQDTTWSWDTRVNRWYMHRFFPHQPDLNIDNPRVRDEIHRIIGLWLELGLSGFRVDAVPFLIEASDATPEARRTRTTTCATCVPSCHAAAVTRCCSPRRTSRSTS